MLNAFNHELDSELGTPQFNPVVFDLETETEMMSPGDSGVPPLNAEMVINGKTQLILEVPNSCGPSLTDAQLSIGDLDQTVSKKLFIEIFYEK